MMPLVFVVDGVAERRNVVQYALEQAGYPVETFATTQAFAFAEQQLPALIVVAIELPDGSGVDFCQRVREHPVLGRTPVILVADNKIEKYRRTPTLGSSECLSFPLAPGELVNAAESALHRAKEFTLQSFDSGDIFIDRSAMKIAVRGREVTTTILEFRLLDYMAHHHGKVFSRDALLDAVWGDLQFVTPRSVDACIRRIRRKIEPDSSSPIFLKTIRGIGYKLDAKPVWERVLEQCQCPTCSAARVRTRPTPVLRSPHPGKPSTRSVSFR